VVSIVGGAGMGKIGRYEYPEHSLKDCIDWVKLLIDNLKGDLSDENRVAGVLGHKAPRGGAYIHKMLALERYGLIERGHRTTELADRVVYLTGEEKYKAVLEAFHRVELFRQLDERFPTEVKEEEFPRALVAITGVSLADAVKKSESILKIYKEGKSYINSIKPVEARAEKMIEAEQETISPLIHPPIAMPTFSIEAQTLTIKVPLDIEAIDFATKQIPTWLEYAKKQIKARKAKETKEE